MSGLLESQMPASMRWSDSAQAKQFRLDLPPIANPARVPSPGTFVAPMRARLWARRNIAQNENCRMDTVELRADLGSHNSTAEPKIGRLSEDRWHKRAEF